MRNEFVNKSPGLMLQFGVIGSKLPEEGTTEISIFVRVRRLVGGLFTEAKAFALVKSIGTSLSQLNF